MAWRFKASKYKNAAAKFPKREEWIPELSVGNLMQSCGNHIKASCAYMAFNVVSTGGGNLGILPVSTSGRLTDGLPLLHAHGDYATDFEFSPFDDYLLATGSADNTVKVWLLPKEEDIFSSALSSVNASRTWTYERRVENVTWNPVAEGVLAATVFTSVKIYDVERGVEKFDLDVHKDQCQSLCWHRDGSKIATSSKDKFLRVIDPRSQSVVQETSAFQSNKDSRAIWVGNGDLILTSGYNASRVRQAKVWDGRNLNSALHSIDLSISTGIVMPLYDHDTGMLYLIGKGDNTLKYCEVTETSPHIVENFVERSEQVKGACMVPKRAMNVMDGEVNRLLLLTKTAIIPTPVIVPRKSYREYHQDIFPDTPSGEATLSSAEWFSGQNGQLKMTSLDPTKKPPTVTSHYGHLLVEGDNSGSAVNGTISSPQSRESTPATQAATEEVVVNSEEAKNEPQEQPQETESNPQTDNIDGNGWSVANKTDEEKEEHVKETAQSTSPVVEEQEQSDFKVPEKPSGNVFNAGRSSKFKHLKGNTLHKSTHISNIRKLNKTVPGESDMFHANKKRCVVPLEGSGGILAVFELDKPGRLGETGIPTLQHKSKVLDFLWDPFDDNRLVVACEDAKIWVWDLPEGGLTETLTTPTFCLSGHMEKIHFLKFHPLAKDILLSAAYDLTVRIWDLSDRTEVLQLEEHPDQIFCGAWSPDGKYIATVCKDGNIRVYNPRKYKEALMIGPGPSGSRGARVVWVLDGQYLVVTGFSRMNNRTVQMFDTANLEKPLDAIELSPDPSILVPYYDEDSHCIFATGRGDGTLFTFDVSEEAPNLSMLTAYRSDGLHQAFSFLPKIACNVREVEFAKALRLTNNTVEPVSFTVPRVRSEFFQDDLFPYTRMTWEPSMTSEEWLSGLNNQPDLVSLQPTDMTPLSEAPAEAPKVSKYDSYSADTYKTDEQKKEELLSAMTNKLTKQEEPLPQDLAEGVDSDEWEDD